MQSLSDLSGYIDIAYRSDENSLLAAFYAPCLQRSVLYQRAVGYFTSDGLAYAARGVVHLLANGGRIELVCSPHLIDEDIEALRRGYRGREEVLLEAASRSFTGDEGEFVRNQLDALAWLVTTNALDVKLAVPVGRDSLVRSGIYHEKFGIFTDGLGHQVAFSGSSNETRGGLLDNFESIDVFWSWDDPHGRVRRKVEAFQRLWNGRTANLEIVDFTKATEEILRPYKRPSRPPAVGEPGEPYVTVNKWRHQDEAVSRFLEKERGVLNMATGTGKTRTALRICQTLLDRGDIDSIIVSTDGNDLLDQWYKELLNLLKDIPQSLTAVREYSSHHDRDRFSLNPRNKILLVSRPTLAVPLRRLSAEQGYRTLLIHDEVHRLGSPGNRRELGGRSEHIRFRLGLSATPEREYDQEGTAFIEDHVGPIIFEFGLGDAIRRGILSPFNYFPLEYDPDPNDRQRIADVFKQVAARKHSGDPMSQEEIWIALARVHKTSQAKLPIFEGFIRQRPDLLERCIIFVETMEYGADVLDIVHRYRHDFHTYFGGEDPGVLQRFARGEIECLLTCHRLSEGIDIRSLRTVILFSSARAQLETIQRMGRCLRFDPADPDKVANVVDFIRRPDLDEEDEGAATNADDERRGFLESLAQITLED